MHIIAGLGNPGSAYARSRHNIGFMCVDRLAQRHEIRFMRRQGKVQVASGAIAGSSVLLAKPQAYMNESGQAVAALVRFHRIPMESLVVVYDDLDLPLGKVRIRKFGGHGGHNGMRSIISHLGSQDFPRIRVGIGRPPGAGASDPEVAARYVLSPFAPGEREIVDMTCERVADALEVCLADGIEAAMNQFNT